MEWIWGDIYLWMSISEIRKVYYPVCVDILKR